MIRESPGPTLRMAEPSYLVRHGLFARTAGFRSGGAVYQRGQSVVVWSASRGTEIGEVLSPLPARLPPPDSRILRPAQTADLVRARRVLEWRRDRLAQVEPLFGSPALTDCVLLDIEVSLEGNPTILTVLGADRPEILQTVRAAASDLLGGAVCVETLDRPAEVRATGCGSCGQGGCPDRARATEGARPHACESGCGHDCGLKDLLASRPSSPPIR